MNLHRGHMYGNFMAIGRDGLLLLLAFQNITFLTQERGQPPEHKQSKSRGDEKEAKKSASTN